MYTSSLNNQYKQSHPDHNLQQPCLKSPECEENTTSTKICVSSKLRHLFTHQEVDESRDALDLSFSTSCPLRGIKSSPMTREQNLSLGWENFPMSSNSVVDEFILNPRVIDVDCSMTEHEEISPLEQNQEVIDFRLKNNPMKDIKPLQGSSTRTSSFT